MKITAILCTCNRCDTLDKALESLASSRLSQGTEWEVIVVDNNSRDRTRDLVEEYCRRYPGHFRYLFEPRPGKSYALNSGIREAGGDILVFTDDDVIVDQNWLQNIAAGLEDGRWVGAGGRTFAEPGFVPPAWLPQSGRYALPPLALFDFGSEPSELKKSPFGNNMAFHKSMFVKHGGFRTDLGPRFGSKGPQKSEDSEFGMRLLARGERFLYEPSAIVYHAVPKNRARKSYFLAWWFDKVRADIRVEGIPGPTRWFICGVPLYLFRRLAFWTFQWIFTFKPADRFECRIKAWAKVGQITECYRMWREGKAR